MYVAFRKKMKKQEINRSRFFGDKEESSNMKEIKLGIIILLLLILIVIIFVFIFNIKLGVLSLRNMMVFVTYFDSSTTLEKSWCQDGDSKELSDGRYVQSQVFYVYNKCEHIQDISGDKGCGFMLTANDVCQDTMVLLEQTCEGDYLVTKKINCEKGCLGGKCL